MYTGFFRCLGGMALAAGVAAAQPTSSAPPTGEAPAVVAPTPVALPESTSPPAPAPSTPPPPPRTATPEAAPEFEGLTIPDSERAWRDDYPDLPADRGFAEVHRAFWEGVILASGEDAAIVVEDSATFAAESIVDALDPEVMDGGSLGRALAWLDSLYPRLDETMRANVTTSMGKAFGAANIDIRPLLEVGPESDFAEVSAAMQTCMTLALYTGASTLHRWIQIPEVTRGFLERHGIMLFDNGILDPQQLDCLGSLFDAIPFTVHGVVGVVVPQGMRAQAEAFGLRTPGLVLDIDSIPMNVYSQPEEFFPPNRQYAVPEFTLSAGMQLMRATQFVQFQQRPELGHRRNTILASASGYATRYVRQLIAPSVYQSNPSELLPLSSYVWFMDSARAWAMALDLYRLEENEAADALLLVADTLSGGSDTTLEFKIAPTGRVESQPVPLRRTILSPGIAYASGIGIDGTLWSFSFDGNGGVTGLTWN